MRSQGGRPALVGALVLEKSSAAGGDPGSAEPESAESERKDSEQIDDLVRGVEELSTGQSDSAQR